MRKRKCECIADIKRQYYCGDIDERSSRKNAFEVPNSSYLIHDGEAICGAFAELVTKRKTSTGIKWRISCRGSQFDCHLTYFQHSIGIYFPQVSCLPLSSYEHMYSVCMHKNLKFTFPFNGNADYDKI